MIRFANDHCDSVVSRATRQTLGAKGLGALRFIIVDDQ